MHAAKKEEKNRSYSFFKFPILISVVTRVLSLTETKILHGRIYNVICICNGSYNQFKTYQIMNFRIPVLFLTGQYLIFETVLEFLNKTAKLYSLFLENKKNTFLDKN